MDCPDGPMPEGDEDPMVVNSGQSQEVRTDEHRPCKHGHKTGEGDCATQVRHMLRQLVRPRPLPSTWEVIWLSGPALGWTAEHLSSGVHAVRAQALRGKLGLLLLPSIKGKALLVLVPNG